MRIKYFSDTDTALLEFVDRSVAETVGISDDIYVDIDDKGRLVSMTIEHAKEAAGFGAVQLEGIGGAKGARPCASLNAVPGRALLQSRPPST